MTPNQGTAASAKPIVVFYSTRVCGDTSETGIAASFDAVVAGECLLSSDGFESGDTSGWDQVVGGL